MEDQVLHYGAYGLIFFLGLLLVLRPLLVLRSLILRPGFLVLTVLLAVGARAALVAAPAENAPIMVGGVMAFVVGNLVGFPLRFLARGVL